MAKNLRDQGYPGTTTTPKIKTRTAKKASGKAQGQYKKEITEPEYKKQAYPKYDVDQVVNDKAAALSDAANAVLGKTSLPLTTSGGTNLIQPDYNWGNFTDATIAVRTPNNRLGYVGKNHYFDPNQPDTYVAGIDNLYALGETPYEKNINLPLGITADVGYDGDGTVYGDVNVPQHQYYVNALMNLLNK